MTPNVGNAGSYITIPAGRTAPLAPGRNRTGDGTDLPEPEFLSARG
jgi:hypothetical protein